jgi:uncharacterized protein DUF2846
MHGSLARVIVIGICLLLAACSTTALESQTKAQGARQARVYFLRGNSLLSMGGIAPEIKINGQKVGTLANSSYFLVDRDPGPYKISVETALEIGRFSVDVTLRPGSVSYIEVAPRPGNIMATAVGGLAGGLIDAAASDNGNSGRFSVALMDEMAGVALLQRLKQ